MNDIDPRPVLRHAQEWVAGLIDGLRPDQLERPTPCSDWTVRELLGHIVAGARRTRAMGADANPMDVPAVADITGDVAAEYREAVDELWQAWDDDALLDREFQAPWGVIPGAGFLSAQTLETVTHGWDLAVATGQDSEAPADAASLAFGLSQLTIPADGRAQRPFGEVKAAQADAGTTERLAAWLGRSRP